MEFSSKCLLKSRDSVSHSKEILSPIVETLLTDVEILPPIGEILSLIWAILSLILERDYLYILEDNSRRIPPTRVLGESERGEDNTLLH